MVVTPIKNRQLMKPMRPKEGSFSGTQEHQSENAKNKKSMVPPPKMVVPILALLTPIKKGAYLEGQQKSGNTKHILEVTGKPVDNIVVVHPNNIVHEHMR